MPRSIPDNELIHGALEMRGQQFPFYLEHRVVDLGPAGKVQYYYMPVSRFRDNDPEQDVSNFQSCVDFWFAVVQQFCLADDWTQQSNYILATCYALVRKSKGQQDIYRDALLRPNRKRRDLLKPSPEVCERIARVIKSRDSAAVRTELNRALEAHQFNDTDRLGVAAALQHWMNRGLQYFRDRGRDGLLEWHQEVEGWIATYRKRSDPRVRLFVNSFAYECKVSFYLCYANFWIGLIPWLRENRNLDPISERFLRVWHNQNRPIELAHGQTAGGIYYPTHCTNRVLLPDGRGELRPTEITQTLGTIGPEAIPDAFNGQVLALHPLSWELLAREALRAKVGAYIASPAYAGGVRLNATGSLPEYWSMVEAILTAAYLYQQLRMRHESERADRPAESSLQMDQSQRPDASILPISLLRDYVDGVGKACPCGGRLRFEEADLPAGEGDKCDIPVACDQCELASCLTITIAELRTYLKL